nr:MAG TPA: hypothetical protein [Caudoviricetes sp.]
MPSTEPVYQAQSLSQTTVPFWPECKGQYTTCHLPSTAHILPRRQRGGKPSERR